MIPSARTISINHLDYLTWPAVAFRQWTKRGQTKPAQNGLSIFGARRKWIEMKMQINNLSRKNPIQQHCRLASSGHSVPHFPSQPADHRLCWKVSLMDPNGFVARRRRCCCCSCHAQSASSCPTLRPCAD